MPWIVRLTAPGVARPMFSAPMTLAEAKAAERALKRKHGFGVTVKNVQPTAHNARTEVDVLVERAAARRAS